MKRSVLLIILAVVVGFGLGLGVTYGILAPDQSSALAVSDTVLPSSSLTIINPTPTASDPVTPLDTEDNGLLLEKAGQLLEAMKAGNYPALAAMVHPEKGVRFTPYSTVDLECNQVLTVRQISALDEDTTVYTWGVVDGTGDPIQLTGVEYFSKYVFNADYTTAPYINVDKVLFTGNALENAADAYPDGRFVEYHFPSLDEKQEGYDWCSLKLVMEPYQNTWYLVGLIHSEWTI